LVRGRRWERPTPISPQRRARTWYVRTKIRLRRAGRYIRPIYLLNIRSCQPFVTSSGIKAANNIKLIRGAVHASAGFRRYGRALCGDNPFD
jgi:hypothetical protein